MRRGNKHPADFGEVLLAWFAFLVPAALLTVALSKQGDNRHLRQDAPGLQQTAGRQRGKSDGGLVQFAACDYYDP